MVRITTTPRYVGKRIREEIARLPLNTYVTGKEHLPPGNSYRYNGYHEWMKRLMQGNIGLMY